MQHSFIWNLTIILLLEWLKFFTQFHLLIKLSILEMPLLTLISILVTVPMLRKSQIHRYFFSNFSSIYGLVLIIQKIIIEHGSIFPFKDLLKAPKLLSKLRTCKIKFFFNLFSRDFYMMVLYLYFVKKVQINGKESKKKSILER